MDIDIEEGRSPAHLQGRRETLERAGFTGFRLRCIVLQAVTYKTTPMAPLQSPNAKRR